MTNLGDTPMYLINQLATPINGISGGDPMVLALLSIILVAYFALVMKLDRGTLVLVGLGFAGVMFAIGIMPPIIFWGIIMVVGLFAAAAFMQTVRQGER